MSDWLGLVWKHSMVTIEKVFETEWCLKIDDLDTGSEAQEDSVGF